MDNINKIYSISPPGFMRPDSDDISVDNTTSTTSESMQNCIDGMPLAMAYVPRQTWQNIYENSREALDYYHKAVKEYNDAVNIFITNFGPLEATQVKSRDNWTWTEGCMPWEGECNVEL